MGSYGTGHPWRSPLAFSLGAWTGGQEDRGTNLDLGFPVIRLCAGFNVSGFAKDLALMKAEAQSCHSFRKTQV